MKYPTLIFLALIFVFTTCEKDNHIKKITCTEKDDYEYLDNYKIDSMCTSELCTEYFQVWKELLQEKNNLSHSFFDAHIELCESEISSWVDGVSFSVCYKFSIGWAIAYNCDQFIIKIDADNSLCPSLALPRDIYLSKEQVKIAVDNRAFSSDIIKIANTDNIRYPTMDIALRNLIAYSGVSQLCINQISINKDNGHLMLKASAQYENEENSCINGTVDLITGAKEIKDTPCWVY